MSRSCSGLYPFHGKKRKRETFFKELSFERKVGFKLVMGSEMAKERMRCWWWNRDVIIGALAVASVAGCIYYHCSLKAENTSKADEILVSMCEERSRMLQDQFSVSVNHVHALAILVSTFRYQKQPSALDQETFAHYTAMTAFERPLLNGVAYAQRVVHSERENFENQQGWTIKTFELEPSPVKNEYAPVIYSQETVSYIEALDMMSGEEDKENILRARATGKAVLTRPFRLLHSNHLGVVLTFPVYRSGLPTEATVEERVEATVGYLGGAFDVESLVENLLKQLTRNRDITVNVYDVTNNSEPLVMYGPQHPDGYMPLSHANTLDFGDPFRKHRMVCRYSQKPPIPLSAISTPCGLLVILLLLLYIMYAAWSRYENVKEDYRKMEELKVKAEAADVAKSQFLATVSHEIRTPMNGVLGMLDMLLDSDLNLTQKDFVQTAQVCGKALIALINEVLDRAKIEAGKVELEAVPFDLRSILDDVLSLFSAKSREKGVELAVFVSDRVPEVIRGDPGRFRQIITNLVANSIKFTERGHIFVQVHLAENPYMPVNAEVKGELNEDEVKSSGTSFNTLSGFETANDRSSWENFSLLLSDEASLTYGTVSGMPVEKSDFDEVQLIVSVEDTGIGIQLHVQDRVFTPFMQADSSTSRNYGGTGIGLSISKCLVELMGGHINFVSRPHIGSTFTFTAVFQRCEQSKDGDTKRSPEALPSDFKGMDVILVDQRPVRGVVTKYHLHRLGISVHVATNINEVHSALSAQNGCLLSGHKKQPLVVLIEKDLWSTGADVCLRNWLLERRQNGRVHEVTKVILLVTSESDKTNDETIVDAVIMKPLRASTVAACLQQALGLTRQQNEETLSRQAKLRNLLSEKNILVVDDNKVNLRVAAAALKKYGAKVKCVESGMDALSLLQIPHKFDACFMDVQMPEMDGFEATRQIRLLESKAEDWHLPVLAMTADVIQATNEECIKCGMDGYVSKPFDEKKLYQAVAKFLVSDPAMSAASSDA